MGDMVFRGQAWSRAELMVWCNRWHWFSMVSSFQRVGIGGRDRRDLKRGQSAVFQILSLGGGVVAMLRSILIAT